MLRFETLDSIEDRVKLRKRYKNLHALVVALPMSEKPNKGQRSKSSDRGSTRQVIWQGPRHISSFQCPAQPTCWHPFPRTTTVTIHRNSTLIVICS